ncbi:hypothetical protein [Pelagicoccus sp. SDUM812005]|uniref:hypothetical protein n=1 Tax=Pelagicoccus sp. SDUM812005 TaxID=3041257 RepID=UPI00280F8D95|nr:hypothetical protein [Pelagicoccus sp. SDUM812005]MDQ8182207.1 hypothetical protein [Pelagicoccus sp. SDUM812005]
MVPSQANDQSNHLKVGFNYRIPLKDEAKTEWMDRVRKLTKERNDLIHTSLKTMDLKSVEGCQKEIDFLVLQRSRI